VGDIVIVKDDQSKRLFWKVAKVEQLIMSRDGKFGAAVIWVSTPKGTTQLLQRSLKYLFPIEVSSQLKENTITEERVTADQNLDNRVDLESSQGLRHT